MGFGTVGGPVTGARRAVAMGGQTADGPVATTAAQTGHVMASSAAGRRTHQSPSAGLSWPQRGQNRVFFGRVADNGGMHP
jgi:hypothetical protein